MSSPHAITHPAYRPSVMGRNGVVTSADGQASQAGIQIMMAGDRVVSQGIPAFSSTIA